MVRPKYYTPNEVSVHNTLEDMWVSFLGKVYNLTPLCEKYKGECMHGHNGCTMFMLSFFLHQLLGGVIYPS